MSASAVRDPRNVNYAGASDQPKSEAAAAAESATKERPERKGHSKGGKKGKKGLKGGKLQLMRNDDQQKPLQLYYSASGQEEKAVGERRLTAISGTKGSYKLTIPVEKKDVLERKAKQYIQKQYVNPNKCCTREIRFVLSEYHAIIYREICKLAYSSFFVKDLSEKESDRVNESSFNIVLGRHLFLNSMRSDYLSPHVSLAVLDVLESLKNNDIKYSFVNEIIEEDKLPDLTGFTKSEEQHPTIHQLKGTNIDKSSYDLTLQRVSSENCELGLVSATKRGGRTIDTSSFSEGVSGFRVRIFGAESRKSVEKVQAFANETKLIDNKLWMPLQNSMRVSCYREKILHGEAHVGIYTKGLLEIQISRVYTSGKPPFYYVEISCPQLTNIIGQATQVEANQGELFRSFSQVLHMFISELVVFLKWGETLTPEPEPELWDRFNQKMLDEYRKVEESKVFWASERKEENNEDDDDDEKFQNEPEQEDAAAAN